MEDCPNLHLTSPPSSLTDGLFAPRVSTPPVPRPRKTPSLSLVSTPKHPASARHPPPTPHANGLECHHNKNSRGHHGMQRAPSLDSATHRDLPLSPITQLRCPHSDSETEEDSSPSSQHQNVRLSAASHHGKHYKKPLQQHSHSLPATPRVNGSSHHSGLNGGIYHLGTSPSYNTLPYLLAAQAVDQSNQESISPSTSQYITCHTGGSHLENSAFLGAQDSKLTGVIDYSSLPLPEENQEPVKKNQDISRHMSEPCITEYQRCAGGLACSPRKRGLRHKSKGCVLGKENEVMDNIKESGQSEGEAEDNIALEVQWRFIQTLVSELNVTKASNRKLMADLHQAKMEIQVLRASLDAYTENGLQPGAITEMVGQIHAAQKVRDEAMMSRIKLANEERDAALTHSRTMMDKLNLSPQGTIASASTVDAAELDHQSGTNSSCTSSPRRGERRHRKSCDLLPSLMSSGGSYTSTPPVCNQGSEQRSLSEREVATLAQLAALEEELRTLRLATAAHHRTPHEGGEAGALAAQGISNVSNEYVEGLCTQLRESEASRWQMHDRCARMERLVNALRKKVNGLNVVESSVQQEGTKLTLVDLSLHAPPVEGASNSGHHNTQPSTSSEGEPKDSLSSLESVETASASSWKKGEVPTTTSVHSSTSLHSSYVLLHCSSPHNTLNTSHSNNANLVHSSMGRASPLQSAPTHSNHPNLPPSSGQTPNSSPHHHHHHHFHHHHNHQQQQGLNLRNDRDSKHIPGVTIVGPITEL